MAGNTKKYVVDASFVISFLMPDEQNQEVTRLFDNFKMGKAEFISTYLLPFEVLNSLKSATLQGRISIDTANHLKNVFLSYFISLQQIDYNQTFKLSLESNVSFYDATYVYLAKEYTLPLLTLDKKLQKLA